MEQSTNKKRQIIASLAVLLVIAVIGGGLVVSNSGSDTNESASTSQTTANTPTTAQETTAAPSNATYKDGQYSAEGDYNSPGGPESIAVNVTVKDGVITATTADGSADSGTAQYHQQQFIQAFADEVIGKKIADLKLDRVAGSSLTTNGFNDAIEQIRSDAQA